MPHSIDLTSKNALVTGGTRGIGRTISLRLAQAGARVAMIYRSNSEAATETLRLLKEENGLDHIAVQSDISIEAEATSAVSSALERFSNQLHILVLDAAAGTSGPLAETPVSDWLKPFDTNLHGHLFVCRTAFEALQSVARASLPVEGGATAPRAGTPALLGGSVIFISSGAGHDPIPGLGAYGVSKAAVNHLATVLAQEWGPSRIRVNVVSPGHTAMSSVDYDNLTKKQKEIVETTALRRLGTPDDVANAVLFFASDFSGFVTGQFLRVNGGRI